ncbi:MAG: hypothetical protein A2Y23_05185 [Clostridiales bacterium GWB2_37_7]|nr:MAG: hypothetical protein A2Y23_05185 [Clostridiales bacterium GWB2_37_7]
MLKKWTSFIIIFVMVLSFTTVFADVPQAPQVYTIIVTEDGGKYVFDNVELTFKKDSMEKGMQPITFTVAFYAENGVPYIDINPSVDQFAKDVKIKVKKAEVELYDITTGENINIELENYSFKVEHFSRYIIQD